MAVLPGLIDLHFHTAVGKGYCDHLPLWESLEQFWYPSIRALDAETAYWAAAASYAESIKCGVTTVTARNGSGSVPPRWPTTPPNPPTTATCSR
jgi:cytosine/adenosine deaminase-related metal-dependent hydrolase